MHASKLVLKTKALFLNSEIKATAGRHKVLPSISFTRLSHVHKLICTHTVICLSDFDLNPDPDRTAKNGALSRFCSSTIVQNEIHDEFCQNIRSERRVAERRRVW